MPCATLDMVLTFGCAIPRASNSSGCSHALCHFTHGSHLWLCNTQGIKEFRVFDRQLDDLLDLLNLLVQTSNHLIRGVWDLFHHHQAHQWVHLASGSTTE